MDVLLTFTGFHDPFFKGLIDQEEQPGPILSLLAARSFDHIFLFDTPSTQRITQETKDAISKLYQRRTVYVLEIPLDDPTDYQEMFRGVKTHAEHTLVRELERVKNQAKALGIFTDDRELIKCPSCGLLEDVTFEGLLVTYQKDSKDLKDSGLRFVQAGNTHFECPRCGARVEAQIL